ncbi:nicotinate-nucleotide--dimethylbenzimidazole phosphoribosyltransferase [Iodidimonas sp. SYSU 1G8]|uniref:nicotinate-nucleotide--dimethylbenzimidazole phosphoribosyltransferase n=1 Tax=Iodidimonas sp. SYSU 1G8 TaxID=3133967 RepID=UPI0031FE5B06
MSNRLFETPETLAHLLRQLPGADPASIERAAGRQGQLTKPPGALGRLEGLALFMAGWQGTPRADRVQAIVFAGNHGVTAQGISPFPAAVTAQMVANFRSGGAAVNALAGTVGADLSVVALELDRPTGDISEMPALSDDEVLAALNSGAAAVDEGTDILVLGEMGIGNTTVAAALCAASYGGAGADWAGPGTGMTGKGVAHKAAIVDRALARHGTAARDPFQTLASLGGRELCAIAGAIVAARLRRVPVLLDGFVVCAALAPLAAHSPDILAHCIAGHVSAEPGHRKLLAAFGLTPLLSLRMRLGEGTGALLAVSVLRGAVATHNGMATFAEAGVSSEDGHVD